MNCPPAGHPMSAACAEQGISHMYGMENHMIGWLAGQVEGLAAAVAVTILAVCALAAAEAAVLHLRGMFDRSVVIRWDRRGH